MRHMKNFILRTFDEVLREPDPSSEKLSLQFRKIIFLFNFSKKWVHVKIVSHLKNTFDKFQRQKSVK
jgi:hypothetical protein